MHGSLSNVDMLDLLTDTQERTILFLWDPIVFILSPLPIFQEDPSNVLKDENLVLFLKLLSNKLDCVCIGRIIIRNKIFFDSIPNPQMTTVHDFASLFNQT